MLPGSLPRAFLYVWLTLMAISIVSPFEASSGCACLAYVMSFIFVTCSVILSGLFFPVTLAGKSRPINVVSTPYTEKLILLVLAISILGTFFLWIDKTSIKGIDYSQGMAQARVQWGGNESVRGGVSSIYSLLGYLLGFYFFVSTYAVLMYRELYSTSFSYFVLLVSLCLVLFNSFMVGGRSILFVFVMLVLSVMIIRKSLGLTRIRPKKRSFMLLVSGVSATVLVIGYSIYVVYSRAKLVGMSSYQYLEVMVEHLNGKVLYGSSFDVVNYFYVVAAYLIHPFWVFEESLALTQRPGQVLFVFLNSVLSKAGVVDGVAEGYEFHGLFLSVPGAFYYEFGMFGYLSVIILTALLIALLRLLRRGGDVSLITMVLIGMYLLSSPILFIFDFMVTGFVVWAFFTFWVFEAGRKVIAQLLRDVSKVSG